MALKVKTGTYTGNGSTSGQAITGIGFQPKFLLIGNAATSNNAFGSVWKSEDMPASSSVGESASLGENGRSASGNIQSLNSDGFTVGGSGTTGLDSANTNGTVYYYLALGGDDTEIFCSTYTGNGSSRSITGVGFQPELVLLQGGSQHTFGRFGTMAGNYSVNFTDGVANGAGLITAIGSDGFSLSNASSVNGNGVVYYYVAVKSVTTLIKTGQYTGDGNDDRNITGVGFQPSMVLVRSNTTDNAMWTTKDVPAGSSLSTRANAASETNNIQSILSDGFQVGTDAKVNQNTTTNYYLAFKDSTNDFTSTLTETATMTDFILRTPLRTLSESSTMTDTFTGIFVYAQTLQEAVAAIDTLIRATVKTLSDTVTATDSIIRTALRTLSETATAADTVIRQQSRTLAEAIITSDTIRKVLNGSATIWSHVARSADGVWSKVTKSTSSWTHIDKS